MSHPLDENTAQRQRRHQQSRPPEPPPMQERRKDGWTLTREIVGTIVGVAAVAIPLSAGFASFLYSLSSQVATHSVQISNIYEGQRAAVAERQEINRETNSRLVRIEDKVDRIVERQR